MQLLWGRIDIGKMTGIYTISVLQVIIYVMKLVKDVMKLVNKAKQRPVFVFLAYHVLFLQSHHFWIEFSKEYKNGGFSYP